MGYLKQIYWKFVVEFDVFRPVDIYIQTICNIYNNTDFHCDRLSTSYWEILKAIETKGATP